jgi:hypothetical protein
VAEDGIFAPAEIPAGWGLLVRRGDALLLEKRPVWTEPEAGHSRQLLEAIAQAGTRATLRGLPDLDPPLPDRAAAAREAGTERPREAGEAQEMRASRQEPASGTSRS